MVSSRAPEVPKDELRGFKHDFLVIGVQQLHHLLFALVENSLPRFLQRLLVAVFPKPDFKLLCGRLQSRSDQAFVAVVLVYDFYDFLFAVALGNGGKRCSGFLCSHMT